MNFKKALFYTAVLASLVSCEKTGNGNTDNGGTDPVDYIEMKDGFMAYDGLDSSSGMYRTNIMLCSESMDASKREYPYYDVTIFVYTKYDLEQIDSRTREVPYGNVTPFFTNGVGLSDMMYYIGGHGKDEDGNDIVNGTAWYYYTEPGGTAQENNAASDTDNTEISITDNGDGTYTVKGTLVDDKTGKSINFKYTDNKKVFDMGGYE